MTAIKTYIFVGRWYKKIYYFGTPRSFCFRDTPKDVQYEIQLDDNRVPLKTEVTTYDYTPGQPLIINDRPTTIQTIAREVGTANYYVYTTYDIETIDDLESKAIAEAQKQAYLDAQKKEQKHAEKCEKQVNECDELKPKKKKRWWV